MTLAIDADVLVHWLATGAERHRAVNDLLKREIANGVKLGLVPQVACECLHVVTDRRRFSRPPSFPEATERLLEIWMGREVERIQPDPRVPERTFELLTEHSLGRKRILDTALAATLELAGIQRLATLNGRDFQIFPFLEIVEP